MRTDGRSARTGSFISPVSWAVTAPTPDAPYPDEKPQHNWAIELVQPASGTN